MLVVEFSLIEHIHQRIIDLEDLISGFVTKDLRVFSENLPQCDLAF